MTANKTLNTAISVVNAAVGKNRIINGDMRIDQRNFGASITNNGSASSYAVDRMQNATYGCPSCTNQQVTDAPSSFSNSYKITITSGSLGSSAYGLLLQYIEGVNFDDLAWGTSAAKTITFSCWVKTSVTGTYSVFLRNPIAYSRYYVSTFTISSANTWTYVSITVPGDTSGSWAAGTAAGLQIGITLGCGSGYAAAALNTWTSGTQFATSSSVNIYSTNGATFLTTGWQVEQGSVATPFERRHYGLEYTLCQRYFQQLPHLSGASGGTTVVNAWGTFPVPMRATPTVYQTGVLNFQGDNVNNSTQSSVGLGSVYCTYESIYLASVPNFSLTAYRPGTLGVPVNNSNYVYVVAEL